MEKFFVKIQLIVSGNGTNTYRVSIFDSFVNHLLGMSYQGISGKKEVINRFLELEARKTIYDMFEKNVEIINIDTKETIK